MHIYSLERINVANIIDDFRIIHGNKYDYSRVNYVNNRTKVTIVCPIHGEFEQFPKNHMKGHGCPKCGRERMGAKYKFMIDECLEQLNEVHGDKYDYSLITEPFHKTDKIRIICPVHGEFLQLVKSHFRGSGCPECGRGSSRSFHVLNREEFISKAQKIHDGRYNYSKVNYISNKVKVTIVCPIHGEFEQIPNSHLLGKGCPSCSSSISSGHREIINALNGYEIFINDRSVISPYELDIYVPEEKLAIEYNGNYWHSFGRQESTEEKQKHRLKHLLCRDAGIELLQIFEYEWTKKKDIIGSILQHKLGKSMRVYARDCELVELDYKSAKEFIEQNHLYGHRNATVTYGLKHSGSLVSAISFNKHSKYEWEIMRLANRIGYTVVGGVGKLFKHFIRRKEPSQVLTFADARYGTGGVYRKIGFTFVQHTRPNYKYLKGNVAYSRQQFQKHKLHQKLETFDPMMTESENMFNNGYRRIWDSGHYKYVWKKF